GTTSAFGLGLRSERRCSETEDVALISASAPNPSRSVTVQQRAVGLGLAPPPAGGASVDNISSRSSRNASMLECTIGVGLRPPVRTETRRWSAISVLTFVLT